MPSRNVSDLKTWCLMVSFFAQQTDNVTVSSPTITISQVVIMLCLAVLSSSVITTLINRTFSKKTDDATVHKTEAETADILSQAADRTLQMMHQSMVQAQARILVLEERVSHLEGQVKEYERLHGPLRESMP
jgi:sensor histidine kinase YesM